MSAVAEPCLELLREGERAAPVFVFPGTGGDPDELRALAQALQPGPAVFSVAPGALPSIDRSTGVRDMGDAFAEAILALCPDGPHRLVGYSFGGLVALETARRLREMGRAPQGLVLIDAVYDRRRWPPALRLIALARRALRRIGAFRLASGRGVAGAPSALKSSCVAAMRTYRPRYYPGEVDLITTSSAREFGCDVADLWAGLAAKLEVHRVAADHLGLVRQAETVERLAAAVDDCLAAPPRAARPRALVVTSQRWVSAARLALALSEAGFEVEAMSSRRDPIARVGASVRWRRFRPFARLRDLRRAIASGAVDLVFPADDDAAAWLHKVCLQAQLAGAAGRDPAEVVVRSLGPAESLPELHARAKILQLARTLSLRAPETWPARDQTELAALIGRLGSPAVLKSDGSHGGSGVIMVEDQPQAVRAFRKLSRPSALRALRRLILDGDGDALSALLAGRRPNISVQAFVQGRPANAAVACWRGEVLGVVCVQAIHTTEPNGPASVVRTIDHPEMTQTVRKLVQALGLSGLCGFDFVLDPDGHAHLIELNPRATPTCHLPPTHGAPLLEALRRRWSGASGREPDQAPHGEVWALFPHELMRDPHSPFLTEAHHDLPKASPELVRYGMALAERRRRLARIRQALKRDRSGPAPAAQPVSEEAS